METNLFVDALHKEASVNNAAVAVLGIYTENFASINEALD